MAELTKELAEGETEEELNGGLMRPPLAGTELFGGDHKSLEVTREVGLIQLLDEIEERLGDRDKFHVAMETKDHQAPVSDTNPMTIHIHPSEVDMRTVRGVVESHVVDPDYGKTDEDKKLESLKARLAKGDLSLKDLNVILRSVIA
jgi:hypothetical protein